MSVNWLWKDKCGELTLEQEINGERKSFPITLYNGNCFLVMIHEFVEDGKERYSFFGFFSDKDHAKRCLGLVKGESNIYDGWQKFTKLRINKAKCRYFKDIVALFSQAYDNLTIEVYSDPDETGEVA